MNIKTLYLFFIYVCANHGSSTENITHNEYTYIGVGVASLLVITGGVIGFSKFRNKKLSQSLITENKSLERKKNIEKIKVNPNWIWVKNNSLILIPLIIISVAGLGFMTYKYLPESSKAAEKISEIKTKENENENENENEKEEETKPVETKKGKEEQTSTPPVTGEETKPVETKKGKEEQTSTPPVTGEVTIKDAWVFSTVIILISGFISIRISSMPVDKKWIKIILYVILTIVSLLPIINNSLYSIPYVSMINNYFKYFTSYFTSSRIANMADTYLSNLHPIIVIIIFFVNFWSVASCLKLSAILLRIMHQKLIDYKIHMILLLLIMVVISIVIREYTGEYMFIIIFTSFAYTLFIYNIQKLAV